MDLRPASGFGNGVAGSDLIRAPGWQRPAYELLVLVAGLELHFWTDSSQLASKPVRTATALIAVGAVAWVLWRNPPTPSDAGWRPDSWTAGLPSLCALTASACAVLVFAGWQFGTLGVPRDFSNWLWRAAYLSAGQQLLLQVLVGPRLERLFAVTGFRAAAATGLLFGLLHLPNPILTPLTVVAGVAWRMWFQRYRNFPAVWISHYLVGATTFAALEGDWLRRMRVGIGYLIYP